MQRWSTFLMACGTFILVSPAQIPGFTSEAHAMGQMQPSPAMGAPYAPFVVPNDDMNPAYIGLTPATAYIPESALFGAGVTIGIVDGGVDANDPILAGRVSTICIGAATCTGSSHGTEVAEIAAGAPGGIAPWTQIVDANISSNGDQNAGIMAAANAGAKVINVSQAGALNAVAGINYAASKGATVVIAAGNNGWPYFDIPVGVITSPAGIYVTQGGIFGFSPQALSHIIIVGASTNINTKQSISSYPGVDWIGTTGTQTWVYVNPDGTYTLADINCGCSITKPLITLNTFTGPSASLQSLWLMAPMLYTSYAAPQVTAAVALLDARWPVLFRNGTTAQVLFDSAQNIGDPSLYGNGLLRIDQAFQPIGLLMATTLSGVNVPIVMPKMRMMLANGAFGSLPSISASLSNYTVFDYFQRDFKVDLSGLITPPSAASSALAAMTAPKPAVSSMHLADGSSLAFGTMENTGNGIDHPTGDISNPNWFLSFTDRSGSTMAAGYGFPASASFADALWGNDSPIASQASSLGVSSALVSLAEGGEFVAFGTPMDKNTRMAFSWTETRAPDPIANNGWATPNANAFSAGISTHVTSYWTAGVTTGMLSEQAGLLGMTYDQNGPLSLGEQNRSFSMGVSSAVNLSEKSDLLFEATMVRSAGSNNNNSLISDVSPIYARSFGASLVQRDTLGDGDHLQLSVKSPLKVISGTASLATTSVDANGYATTTSQNVSLRPSGNEMDFAVAYQAPVRGNFQWNVSLEDRRDADNIAGVTEIVGLVGAKLTF